MTSRMDALGICALACLLAPAAFAVAPTLYSQPAYESPVSGEPDDLLMLGGYGFAVDDAVVYEAVADTRPPAPPAIVPEPPTWDIGYAAVVSSNNVPHSLTIQLPRVMHPKQVYAIWVRTAQGEWSKPIRINDLRPLWLTPAFVYATSRVARLPRELKLVGRNLSPGPGEVTSVKLSGPQVVTLTAQLTAETMDSFVARVRLPAALLPGRYRVAAARDGSNWVELQNQVLEVRPDTPPEHEFLVSDPRYGGCRGDDGRDAAGCVIKAIDAARAAGGGTVRFGPGSWTLVDSRIAGVTGGDGIVLPEGVSLRGAGKDKTRLVRDPHWNAGSPAAAFSLRGKNRIEGFTFTDTQVYVPADRIGPVLQLGENSDRLWTQSHSAPDVQDVVITGNRFDRTDTAIADGGLAIDRLFVTYNEFGAYRFELELRGDVFNMTNRFLIDDSVIAHNVFKPGSYLMIPEREGPIASEIGASRRLDFSDNIADGASTEFLYSPEDPRGWRAAFFWHMNDNHEMLLMSDNVATCTGDRTGDGEAIGLDNSGNTFAFDAMRPVIDATATSVTVAGPLAARQNNRDIPLATYYVGHWVQVGDGPGMGQARKITGYTIDQASGHVTFTVSPQWDVAPVSGASRASVGREFWQTFILGNRVDHRTPLCQKSNRALMVGGVITLWGQLADSVVAGNELYDTEGVTFHENYNSPTLNCAGCGSGLDFQSFLTIRDNLIEGRYDSGSSCTASGITGWVSAAPNGTTATPTLGYGIDISHNRVIRADNTLVGAIAVGQGWYDGPAPHRWPIALNLIIQHNRIDGIEGPIIGPKCSTSQPRVGISFPGSQLTWKSVLYANSCSGVALPLGRGGKDTTRVCNTPSTISCECQPAAPDR
jgi:hypothetical protein